MKVIVDQDMSGYHPYGQGFEEAGWKFQAWQPSGPGVEQVIIIHAKKDGETRQVKVRLTHEPRFGVDVDDAASAERAVERLIEELRT
jgi:hypothetical protein